jgi:Arc/MetJ family transcription regulator
LIINHMRTTLDLPLELLDEARVALGFKSKTDTVVLALRELVRHRRLDELKALLGRVELDVDVARSRRRPATPAKPKPTGRP